MLLFRINSRAKTLGIWLKLWALYETQKSHRHVILTIKFYSARGDFGEFSNFAPFPFFLDGKEWPTSEHYFQAMKFEQESYQEQIRLAKRACVAAQLGRSRAVPIRPDWESIKVDVMRRAVRSKFQAHGVLRSLLLSTGEEMIIEEAARDDFWGSGPRSDGKNWLGRILMEVREELREQGGNLGVS